MPLEDVEHCHSDGQAKANAEDKANDLLNGLPVAPSQDQEESAPQDGADQHDDLTKSLQNKVNPYYSRSYRQIV